MTRKPASPDHSVRGVVHDFWIQNKKIRDFENNSKKDGLNNTRFRIVNRENYKDKHEIIEVVV